MTAADPGLTALLDQADAATADTADILTRLAQLPGLAAADAAPLAPVELGIIAGMVARAAAGRLGLCPHLDLSPGPCWWTPWAPGRLRCHHCADAAGRRILGTKEQYRCDVCRRRTRHVAEVVRPMPAVIAPALRIGLGPIMVVAGYCPNCHPRPRRGPVS